MSHSSLVNNTIRVKESNTQLIRNVLRTLGVATRSEIAKETNLSIATCGNILKDLLNSNEVFEDELEVGNGGRPARKYLYNKEFSHAICITIDADNHQKTLEYAVVNLMGEIKRRKKVFYEEIKIDTVYEIVESLIAEFPSIKAAALGIPGRTNKEGTILDNDISELNDIEIAKSIETNYKLKVSVASSPSLMAYGYYKNHPELSNKTLATLFVPKDFIFGAGFVIHDEIFKGDTYMAGEVGYMDFAGNEHLKNPVFANVITALTGIISVIAPSVIILAGSMLTEDGYDEICKKCKEIMPSEFHPQFVFQPNPSEDYFNGVINFALDNMSSNLQLISQ